MRWTLSPNADQPHSQASRYALEGWHLQSVQLNAEAVATLLERLRPAKLGAQVHRTHPQPLGSHQVLL